MENKITCPICESTYNFGQVFCESCGWEFKYYVETKLNESERLKEQKRIEIAKKNWQLISKNSVYNIAEEDNMSVSESNISNNENIMKSIEVSNEKFQYIEPEDIQWERDVFETEEEYKERINNLPLIKTGTIELKKENYNIENEKYNFIINWNFVMKERNLIDTPFAYININRHDAKNLFKMNDIHYVYAKVIFDEKMIRPEMYILKFNSLDYVIKPNVKVLNGHKCSIKGVSYSPDGKYLASGCLDNIIKIWEVSSGTCVKTLKGPEKFVRSRVTYSPDGKYIASSSDDNTIKIWEVRNGSCIKTLKGHKSEVTSVTYSPDGKYIASGSDDNTIKIWEVSRKKCIKTLKDHLNYVTSVTYSPDGEYIASGSCDETIKIWEASKKKCIKTLKNPLNSATSVTYSPDGKYITSGSENGEVKIWGVSSGTCVKILRGHGSYVISVTYSPDGEYIASISRDGTIKIWEVSRGKCIETLHHKSYSNNVIYSPDGKYLASGSGDGTIKIWNIDVIK